MGQLVEINVDELQPSVEVRIEWQAQGAPQLIVESTGDSHVVVVDPRLSVRQVEQAIIELGTLGPQVFHAWRMLVGVNQKSLAN